MRLNGKMIVACIATLLCAGNVAAQNLARGIEFHDVNMYPTAKAYLLREIKQNPSAEAYYLLGDTYLMMDQADSAAICFNKSSEQNPSYLLAEVGKGKLKLKEKNTAAAAEIFNQLIKKDKKNPELYVAIANAYATYGLYNESAQMIEGAFKAKKNYPAAYIAEGDNLFKQKKYSESLGKFEQAKYFDTNSKSALIRTSRAYLNVNKDEALKELNTILTIDPQYLPAYIELANYYNLVCVFDKEIINLEKILDIPQLPLAYKQNYAAALYFTQQYDKSLEVAQSILDKDPNNFVMKRIRMYNLFDTEKYDDAIVKAKDFFASKSEDDKYIGIDYQVYGELLEKTKDYETAATIYEKWADLDSTKIDLIKRIWSSYDKEADYPKAIEFMNRYMAKSKDVGFVNYYNFGRTYYKAANSQKEKGNLEAQKGLLEQAIKMFGNMNEEQPDVYLGYLWIAHSLASMNPDIKQGLAKEAYEIAAAKINANNPDGARNSELSACYQYLGNYYLTNDDSKSARPYFEKMLELDPANEQLREFIKAYFK